MQGSSLPVEQCCDILTFLIQNRETDKAVRVYVWMDWRLTNEDDLVCVFYLTSGGEKGYKVACRTYIVSRIYELQSSSCDMHEYYVNDSPAYSVPAAPWNLMWSFVMIAGS